MPSYFQLSDEEEDDVKRLVRSAKEKRYEELNKIIKNIRNSKKIKDFTKMESGFLELVKAYEKAKPVVEKEENGVTPRFFVRVLVELEEVVNEQWEDRDGRKKMSKSNAKSLGSLRQKHRKYIKVIHGTKWPFKNKQFKVIEVGSWEKCFHFTFMALSLKNRNLESPYFFPDLFIKPVIVP